MSNFIDFLLVISKLQSPIYCRYPQILRSITFDGTQSYGLGTR